MLNWRKFNYDCIAGSSVIGNNVVLGDKQASGHLKIGDNVEIEVEVAIVFQRVQK